MLQHNSLQSVTIVPGSSTNYRVKIFKTLGNKLVEPKILKTGSNKFLFNKNSNNKITICINSIPLIVQDSTDFHSRFTIQLYEFPYASVNGLQLCSCVNEN